MDIIAMDQDIKGTNKGTLREIALAEIKRNGCRKPVKTASMA